MKSLLVYLAIQIYKIKFSKSITIEINASNYNMLKFGLLFIWRVHDIISYTFNNITYIKNVE